MCETYLMEKSVSAQIEKLMLIKKRKINGKLKKIIF